MGSGSVRGVDEVQDEGFYDELLAEYGPTARGAGWNSEAAQEQRFEELVKLCAGTDGPISLIDYGCGYGALYDYLQRRGVACSYTGFDISPSRIETAAELHADVTGARFTASEDELEPADYVFASGLFGRTFDADDDAYREYVLATIDRLAHFSNRGFAFNMLTTYSDPDRMRDELYYGDPVFLFDHCMRRYSRRVALLHDYELFDFTIHVVLDERVPPTAAANGAEPSAG